MAAVMTSNYSTNNVGTGQFTQQQPLEDQYLTTFFCRALYDYQSQDASSLSFYRGDIIEVLTQLESGWWDGLLNDERGWFPSNYVEPISDQEAEAELAGSDYATERSDVHDSAIDVTQSGDPRSQLERDENWLQEELEYSNSRNGTAEITGAVAGEPTAASDFWVPQVAPNGQIYYVNTKTGEHSRDLPTELEDDGHDADVVGLSAPTSARNGKAEVRLSRLPRSLGNGVRNGDVSATDSGKAGFGLAGRSGTPEPWVKRLADDGMSYYYQNKTTGQVQWTRPDPASGFGSMDDRVRGERRPTTSSTATSSSGYTSQSSSRDTIYAPSRQRSGSVNSQQHGKRVKRMSVYSDDSDIQPRDFDRPDRNVASSSQSVDPLPGRRIESRNGNRSEIYDAGEEEPFDLTTAERSAMLLQQALTPSIPESIEDLYERAREAIMGVMHAVDDNGLPKPPDHDEEVEQSVKTAVVAVRSLLYISCALSGPLPNSLGERNAGDPTATAAAQQLQAFLKTSQRKATATLSKLVLSARAARFQREMMSADMMFRVEQDAADLQRSIDSFVADVQKQYARTAIKQLHARVGRKRLRGVFGIANIGLGLPGAGIGGFWKGLGYVGLDEDVSPPKRTLSTEVLVEVAASGTAVDERLADLAASLKAGAAGDTPETHTELQDAIRHLWSFVSLVTDINIAQHVDVDGMRRGQEGVPSAEDVYSRAVDRARALVRTLEVSLQALHDDGGWMLLAAQALSTSKFPVPRPDGKQPLEVLGLVLTSMKANLRQVQETLDNLLAVGSDQADAAQNDYNGSIEWRMSRLSILDGARPLSNFFAPLQEREGGGGEEIVDMETAFRRPPGARPPKGEVDAPTDNANQSTSTLNHSRTVTGDDQSMNPSEATIAEADPSGFQSNFLEDPKPVPPPKPEDDILFPEKRRSPPRAAKIRQLLGDDAPERYIDNANANSKPWYLRPTYGQDEILINPDGGIRGGTLPALVERLTTHEYGDPIFIKTFLMTYKSFTNLNELFDLLVARFNIQAPEGLKPDELEEWKKAKQTIVRVRVINTFKTMIADSDVLEKDDNYILERMKDFALSPDVAQLNASKHLLSLIERAQAGGDSVVKMTAVSSQFPPPSIQPKVSSSRKLKFLDVDALEMARQLTILESRFYNKIRAVECLQRARESNKVGEHHDHIADVIQVTNKIAYWVTNTVLSKEDSRKRAAIVKHFISIADRCRTLHNFSSMVAIISGLNSPPIRRLKRTWEQVNSKFMSQLGTCEMTLDSGKNFSNYRSTLAKVNPPCIPFIGVYLTVLTFIQDGSKDYLQPNVINFGKRQKAAEVIREIKHWQSKQFNLNPLPSVLAFIEESLASFNDTTNWNDYFWNTSLEREPREREDEKMARLLQESGFL